MSTATTTSVTSSQPATILTHEHGTGTVAAATMKKKAPAKKCTTNSNMPK